VVAVGLVALERRRHAAAEEALSAQAKYLESLATENARLLADAQVRDTERSLLSDRLITAEQDERRRLALFLHDTSVQSLAGIGLMLEAASHSIESNPAEASRILDSALERHRETIRALRDLSFSLEPVVLRDQGFRPAVEALAEQVGLSHAIQFDLDIDAGETLAEKAQVALYQIIRDSLDSAIRRGPPSRVSIAIAEGDDGSVETLIADDGTGERRRSTFDSVAERARSINGNLLVEPGIDGGTAVRIVLPHYVARR
jgi:signal transduction histidine kinase